MNNKPHNEFHKPDGTFNLEMAKKAGHDARSDAIREMLGHSRRMIVIFWRVGFQRLPAVLNHGNRHANS